MLSTNAQLQPTLVAPAPFPTPEPSLPFITYRHTIEISLKDSNAYGNTYFARYFEWQGVCREQWFFQCVRKDMLKTEGVLITKCAHQDYAHETFPFQKVECQLNTFNVKQCSFGLLFRFYVNGNFVSKGYQIIVFGDMNKKITRFPRDVIEEVKKYEDPNFSISDTGQERGH